MFLNDTQLMGIGFKSVGRNVQISDKAVFYNPGNISIGDNSRIDDFCILSAGHGGIEIGDYVHIGCYTSITGKALVKLCDFSALSPRVSVFSSTDDYSGEFMTNPCIPDEFRRPVHGAVHIGKHVIIGAGTVVLPGSILKDGSCVWAMSLVKTQVEPNNILHGVPARIVGMRKTGFYDQEKIFNGQRN